MSCYQPSFRQHNPSAIASIVKMASPPTTPGESSSSRSTPDESVSHSSRPTPIEVRDAQYTHAHPAGFETSNGLGVPANEPLTKKARGRHVPTKQAVLEPGKRRSFTCSMDGCGKVFSRAEHLRRHVRSIHMDEKRKDPSLQPSPRLYKV